MTISRTWYTTTGHVPLVHGPTLLQTVSLELASSLTFSGHASTNSGLALAFGATEAERALQCDLTG